MPLSVFWSRTETLTYLLNWDSGVRVADISADPHRAEFRAALIASSQARTPGH
ncbi:hypothetical protein [Dermatophilus congolensis]|uniref:hypothetical protein n=1 Tax=Dermatophilus congolensis TaxID=1863 RepID=UPI00041D9DAE|nr:hypothetical protein [Dermatophilus congolensis]MBO3129189.1 hypothetical protein [Dermatophilus congolensis]MBO3132177.1 hypothetical protein [Dermatophilus congolensis]MBO3133667.1 hypothetical protein [Dermatophilus congolensis]MBO3135900.1 hypothetical protein [Dermatophilus congolensis]MBO3138139.1 hypothetical protein [Dermatophilus congolensis]